MYRTPVRDAFPQVLNSLLANWKSVAAFLAFTLVFSMVRRLRWARQRTAADAVARGMGFVPLDGMPLERSELASLGFPFGHGTFRNIESGNINGKEVVLFDTEVNHPHGGPTLQTMAAFKFAGSNLPDFTLQPRSMLRDVSSLFGKSVDFGPESAFSRDYSLESPDEATARTCFTREFREYFEGLERYDSKKNWHLQKGGRWMMIYRRDEGFDPVELQTFLQGTTEIVRNLEEAAEGKGPGS